MENQTPDQDLGDLLCKIEVIRKQLADLGADPTPRMIRWGLAVIDLDGNGASARRGLASKPQRQQWQRVRAFLRPKALAILVDILETLQARQGKQLVLGEEQQGNLNTPHAGGLEGLQRVSAQPDSTQHLQAGLPKDDQTAGAAGEGSPLH